MFPTGTDADHILEEARQQSPEAPQTQRALLNILEDFDSEKARLEHSQRALLNILEDFNAEKFRLESSQRALLNILDDFDAEKARLENSQKAQLNILEDFDEEKAKVKLTNEQLTKEISERRRAEESVRHLNEDLERGSAELEATNKELEAFTYSVSHDLRAPLRHIDGFSKLLLEEDNAGLSEEARRYLGRICDGTRQMGQLVDDLLNLARLGRKELSLQVAGLSSLVEEVVRDLKAENPERVVEWKIQPLPFVECDPALMRQVFANLISNAVKFTRTRDKAVIEVGDENQHGQAVIFVRDNGVGFSMKYAEKLFGIFQRLHRQEDFEGTGVGLATVQRIIHKHGGRVWAEADLNKGATFRFSLSSRRGGS